ncbi:MAG: hypothetical protein H0X02_08180 [Nitrosomonas sp.]|nr:hypothetical protein [Nitrosomonas sp.]
MRKIIPTILAITMFQACNTPPSRITANHHAGNAYERMDCKKLTRELSTLESIISSQRSQLQTDANTDTAIVAGSLILIPIGLVGLAFTGNGDLKTNYADNLGKQTAIKQHIDDKEC